MVALPYQSAKVQAPTLAFLKIDRRKKNMMRVHFLASLCHVCKSTNPKFDCEICGLISYCSIKHRRDHWQHHSYLCRATYKICLRQNMTHLYEKAGNIDCDSFRNSRHAAAVECAILMNRPLESYELEILYHPKMCDVCRKIKDVTVCSDCQMMFTCKEKHFRKNHKTWCSILKMYGDIVKYLHEKEMPLVPDVNMNEIPKSMADVLHRIPIDSSVPVDDATILSSYVSEDATYPLTVLQALNFNQSNITIHFVGAELQAEVLPIRKWEMYLLHLMPSGVQLRLVFVGPDLKNVDDNNSEPPLCPICRDQGKAMRCEMVPGVLYHDYVKKDVYKKPDLVAVLNSGLYRINGFGGEDTWRTTLDVLFGSEACKVLITEYTSEEISRDLVLINERFKGVKQIKGPAINEFASVKPNLNVITDDEIPVIFKNYYYMLLSP